MALPAIEGYDDKFNDLRVAVAVEIERRANLASIPEQITALAATYVEGGGNVSDLSLT